MRAASSAASHCEAPRSTSSSTSAMSVSTPGRGVRTSLRIARPSTSTPRTGRTNVSKPRWVRVGDAFAWMLTNRSAGIASATSTRWRSVSVLSPVRVSTTSMSRSFSLVATICAIASVSCFSRSPGEAPVAPGFEPPCPGSSTTMGCRGAASAVAASAAHTKANDFTVRCSPAIGASPSFRLRPFSGSPKPEARSPFCLTQVTSNATFFRLSRRRLVGALTPVHILVLVALLEVAINRVAVPMLRPSSGAPPVWHTQLDFVGLFLLYFAGTLPLFIIGARVVACVREWRGWRDTIGQLALAIAAVLAAIPLVMVAPDWLDFPREVAFAVAVIALVVSGFARDRDLGAQMGLIVIAVPLLVHSVTNIGARYDWPQGALVSAAAGSAHTGVMALCAAALFSPYVFAPRPFARSVTRPMPILIAM